MYKDHTRSAVETSIVLGVALAAWAIVAPAHAQLILDCPAGITPGTQAYYERCMNAPSAPAYDQLTPRVERCYDQRAGYRVPCDQLTITPQNNPYAGQDNLPWWQR